MPAVLWPLHNERPLVQVVLTIAGSRQILVRNVVADTGAGRRNSVFELLVLENDCIQAGGIPMGQVKLGGAYPGTFPIYEIDVRIPQLNFDDSIPVIGATRLPKGFDGLAGLRFLNRFHYGNFGDIDSFGLDNIGTK